MNVNRTFSNILNSKPIIKSRGYVLNNGATTATAISMTYPPLAASSLTSTAIAVGSIATFTAGSSHRLSTDQLVEITGATDIAFNGIFRITVTSITAFTYILTKTAATTTAGGSPVVAFTPLLQQAVLTADPSNSAAVTIGPDTNADLITLNAADIYVIQSPVDNRQDMADWYYKSASASQKVNVIFV